MLEQPIYHDPQILINTTKEIVVSFNRDEFHRAAIQTPSHEEPEEMRELVVETLAEEGYSPDVDTEGNIRVTRNPSGQVGTHLVFNTHIDTVPPYVPYSRDGNVIRGRGACDAKGPLAAMLDAFLQADIGDGQLTLALSPNEETAQTGGAFLSETLSADGYIVGEPTGLDVCIAARGNFGGHVTLTGESAHASSPSKGHNPLLAVGTLIDALEQYDDKSGPGRHEVLGNPTLAPTKIEAGGPVNQTPVDCTVSFDRRTVPPETVDGFTESLENYLSSQIPDNFHVEVEAAFPESPDPEAFATDRSSTLVETLAEISGGNIRPFEAATEASYFARDAPVVVFGPGVLADEEGPVAHATREYVSRFAVAEAAETLAATAEQLL